MLVRSTLIWVQFYSLSIENACKVGARYRGAILKVSYISLPLAPKDLTASPTRGTFLPGNSLNNTFGNGSPMYRVLIRTKP